MDKPSRKPVTGHREAKRLEVLQRALIRLDDELAETFAWTALVCDGLCGLIAEHSADIDPATHNGMRFATIWLKRRNQEHTAQLQAAYRMLREIRKRQGELRRQIPSP